MCYKKEKRPCEAQNLHKIMFLHQNPFQKYTFSLTSALRCEKFNVENYVLFIR